MSRTLFILFVIAAFGLLGLLYAWNYSEIHALYPEYVIAEDSHNSEIEPYDKLYFKFSQPVRIDEAQSAISFSPPLEGTFTTFSPFLSDYAKGYVFTPSKPLEPEMKYTVTIGKLGSFFGTHLATFSNTFSTITPPQIVSMSPSDGEVDVSSDSRIRIKKDKDSRFFKSEYSVFPEFDFSIDAQGDEVLIVPSEKLKQGTEYSVHVKNMYVSNDNLGKSAESVYDIQMYQFKTADPVNIASVSPSPAGERASIHSEIAIEFNKQVRYEEAENAFSIEPSVDGDFGWEGSTLVFNPKEELASPQEYTVRIAEGVSSYVDNGVLEEDYVFTFNSKRHEKEIDPDEELVPEIVEGKYIDVDLGSQYLTLFEDGISKGTFQISSGRYDLPTPRGTFNIINKVPLAYSNQYDLYMPFWMAFTYAGHGFHELPFWKYRSGYEYKERESNLGTPVSHGCVRLGVGPAEIAYNFADIGTPIVIHD